MLKSLVAGLAGGITMNLLMLLTFRAIGFGWNGHGILLTSPLQSHKGVMQRAVRFAALLFFMVFLFWEFFTPFNQFGEPLPLVALELLFWAAIAMGEAPVIAGIMERGTGNT